MRAIHHDFVMSFVSTELLLGSFDRVLVEVGSSFPTTKDEEAVLIASRTNNRNYTRLGDRQEMVGVLGAIQR
jgi:hypothetical protein